MENPVVRSTKTRLIGIVILVAIAFQAATACDDATPTPSEPPTPAVLDPGEMDGYVEKAGKGMNAQTVSVQLVVALADQSAMAQFSATAVTDKNGYWKIANVAPDGDYEVTHVSAAGVTTTLVAPCPHVTGLGGCNTGVLTTP